MGWALAPHGPRKIREYVFVFRVYFLCLQHVFFFWLGGGGGEGGGCSHHIWKKRMAFPEKFVVFQQAFLYALA